ncbi:hypothetical protein DSCA_37050 [Desulfosarcina alkanivorans]|uniref:Acyl-CoA dehydrogenase/oxidase N-terminal domain-containing protein n=1 Tax=Desulfosarcina alkanivorans TaxID=571177 RepID=A0A5K7YN19_9BACT|nr:hypothetical protein DSCA_37050 [Desulfosarcina alkanivorans]
MDLELTQEQKIIRSSARDFLKKECPVSTMWEMQGDPAGYFRDVWKKMAGLGWQGILIPEKYDGMEGSFIDLAIILEAMGRCAAPGPFFPASCWAAQPSSTSVPMSRKMSCCPVWPTEN